MKIALLCLVLCCSEFCNSQGINFENFSSWEEVKHKAFENNKYILVDCYATWCGPCKKMDTHIYPDTEIGNYANERFICIRMQMDTTDSDQPQVKKWYSTARNITSMFKVNAFPTLLFFAPDGEIVHKSVGFKDKGELMQVLSEALDSNKQYYTLLKKYKSGIKDYAVMDDLAIATDLFGDKEYALSIAKDYYINYLNKLSMEELAKKENIDFITKFYSLENSDGRFFNLFYQRPKLVDSITREGFSEMWVLYIIRKEELESRLFTNGEPVTRKPNWNSLFSRIAEKYDSLRARKLITDARLDFYKRIKNWAEFAKWRDLKIIETPPSSGLGLLDPNGTWLLNADAWEVFLHCTDRKILSRALSWVNLAIKIDGREKSIQMLDTKANLLYKLGMVKQAIALEEEAIRASHEFALTNHLATAPYVDEYHQTLGKMKKGIPTWEGEN